jgi:hypothetical protein
MTTAKTTRGYTAIRIEHIDPRAERLTFTAKKDINIEGVNGASVSIKTGEKFYAVRAASLGNNMFYIVRNVVGAKKCSCPSKTRCVHEVHVATGKPLAELKAEVATRAKSRKAAQQPVVKATQQPVVVSPVVVKAEAKSEQHYTMSPEKLAKLASLSQPAAVTVEEPAEAPKDNVVDLEIRGSLNSAQHAASFWEMLPSRQKNIA